jgi:hypothetical protein
MDRITGLAGYTGSIDDLHTIPLTVNYSTQQSDPVDPENPVILSF